MFVSELSRYDGTLLHQPFAYQYCRDQVSAYGNMIAFRGPMEVLADGMIDQEDVLNKAFIYSDDAVHFLWEVPLLGQNAFGAVAYQRLLNQQIGEILASSECLNKSFILDGDDIMIIDPTFKANNGLGKCSVSITYINGQVALGHTGININAGDRAPAHAYSTRLNDQQLKLFIDNVISNFHAMNRDIFKATRKVG